MASNKKALAAGGTAEGRRRFALTRTVGQPPVFRSAALGLDITLESIADVYPDDLEDLAAEIGAALSEVNASIRVASSEARTTGIHLPRQQWADLQARRGALAALHQKALVRVNQQKKVQKQQRHEEHLRGHSSFDHHFRQVVRNEANPVDYQRWVLQAEARRAAEIARARQEVARG